MPSLPLFLDTSYAVALVIAADQYHLLALDWSDRIQADGLRLLTTRGVLFEIGNSLSKRRHRPAVARLLNLLATDPTIEIVETTPELYDQAVTLFLARPDKDWGLVDCASFVVMAARGLTDALTADIHFEQAGFRALLR